MGLLIDSTLLVRVERSGRTPADLIAETVDRLGDVDMAISVMSAGELLHGYWRADSPARRARREEFVEAVLSELPVVTITLPIMRLFAEIDARLQAEGNKVPTSDLLIASTALSRGDAIVTGDARHFGRIPALTVHDMA